MEDKFSYRLNNYIVAFLFVLAIYVPLVIGVIEKDKIISKNERRELAPLPKIPKTINDVWNFPKRFEKYYSDHFGFRDWLVRTYSRVKYNLNDSPSKDVTIGKNGWMFLGSVKKGYNGYDAPMGDVRNVNLYTQPELKKLAQHFIKLKAWLNERDIEYIFVIAPNKHSIYFEQLPDYISKINNQSTTDQFVEYMAEHTDLTVVDLISDLIKEKKNHQLYYKTDTHWNHFGANIAQYKIMEEIEKLFPGQINPERIKLKMSTRNGGDLARLTGIGTQEYKEQNPLPVFNKTCIPTKQPKNAKHREPHTMICKNQKLNALIFRDSFFIALQPYFSRKFNRSTYVWQKANYKSLKKYIELDKPDIVIEEWVERRLPF